MKCQAHTSALAPLRSAVRLRRDPMSSPGITAKEIDELVRYLPLLEEPSVKNEPMWVSSVCRAPGEIAMGYPTYPTLVKQFFELAGQECWCDHEYDPFQIDELIQNDRKIASASLEQIRLMLTFCVRGERFSDGHWGDMIRRGRIGAILRRLIQVRDEMSPPSNSLERTRGR